MKEFLKELMFLSLGRIGFRTNAKIIAIESDDWGSVRMSSKSAFEFLRKRGYRVDACAYNRYDMLESNTDLDALFNVLLSYRDRLGNHPILTGNMIVANPDFQKIRESGYESYFYEPFTQTLNRYPNHDKVYGLYKKGIESRLFYPQFHGREHVNVVNWMNALREGNQVAADGFSQEMFSLHARGVSSASNEFLDAFSHEWHFEFEQIIKEGLSLFNDLWGFSPCSFIAPCYVWPEQLEPILARNGINLIQGNYIQRVPAEHKRRAFKKKYHYCGEINQYCQRYLVRNVVFEPALYNISETQTVSNCLQEIKTAFAFNKPAIICSHRLNFMGGISSSNRDKNLALLSRLLLEILRRFPDVEFRRSDEIFSMNSNDGSPK